MYHKPKYKNKNYKTSRIKQAKFLEQDTKSSNCKRKKTDKLDFIKNCCDSITKMKRHATDRKYVQNIYLLKDLHPEYIKNYCSIIEDDQ